MSTIDLVSQIRILLSQVSSMSQLEKKKTNCGTTSHCWGICIFSSVSCLPLRDSLHFILAVVGEGKLLGSASSKLESHFCVPSSLAHGVILVQSHVGVSLCTTKWVFRGQHPIRPWCLTPLERELVEGCLGEDWVPLWGF